VYGVRREGWWGRCTVYGEGWWRGGVRGGLVEGAVYGEGWWRGGVRGGLVEGRCTVYGERAGESGVRCTGACVER